MWALKVNSTAPLGTVLKEEIVKAFILGRLFSLIERPLQKN